MATTYENQPSEAPPRAPANGMGTAALVLGILAVLFGFLLAPLGAVLGIVAVILGIAGRKRFRLGMATNGGAATAGIVTGVIGFLIGALITATIGVVIFQHGDTIKKCSQETTQQARQSCINQNLG